MLTTDIQCQTRISRSQNRHWRRAAPASLRKCHPPGTVTYGTCLQAWCVFLMAMHHVPVQRCAAILESLTWARPSDDGDHSRVTEQLRCLQRPGRSLRGPSKAVAQPVTSHPMRPTAEGGKRRSDCGRETRNGSAPGHSAAVRPCRVPPGVCPVRLSGEVGQTLCGQRRSNSCGSDYELNRSPRHSRSDHESAQRWRTTGTAYNVGADGRPRQTTVLTMACNTRMRKLLQRP